MGKKSFALGRGLAAIMKDHDINFKGEQANTINNPSETAEKFEKIVEISIDLIDPNPFQPRKAFDDEELSELADSIKQQGLIQPIALRKVGDRYQIISGERRTRATRIAGLPTIKAQVFEDLDDKAMAEWALIENIQRVDLNPVEIARSYQQLIDKHGYKHEDLAKIVSKSRSAITNSLRLLKLPEQVLLWIEEGKLNSGAARALCSDKIGDPESLAERIIEEGLNVRQIEAIIRGDDDGSTGSPTENVKVPEPAEGPETPAKPKPELSADMKQFESKLETFFGTKVQLNPSSSGKPEGTIVIKYYSMDDLTRIQEIMENR
ncbi:chromosome partitioning protein, ParB family [Fibrobacter sp. UWCM]|uniref:ParB/RepB/Spo0J family partition protein n=1 Tax=Fibrobacter sp. UWCM TaxID=1896208 RepID=UPI0009216D45|nr:ParB/RepB/Spo0J family partition protein [Fibrobacter sp. UWCM]SHH25091.1 chromosome partitioning protein, ParB family [Fibrobacter sp. UWCM]